MSPHNLPKLRSPQVSPLRPGSSLIAATLVVALAIAAHADLPPFLAHAIAGSPIEAALYRAMALPAVQALYPRPPKEAAGQLTTLIAASPSDPQLLTLRARMEEQALDETAAEADWRTAAAHAQPTPSRASSIWLTSSIAA